MLSFLIAISAFAQHICDPYEYPVSIRIPAVEQDWGHPVVLRAATRHCGAILERAATAIVVSESDGTVHVNATGAGDYVRRERIAACVESALRGKNIPRRVRIRVLPTQDPTDSDAYTVWSDGDYCLSEGGDEAMCLAPRISMADAFCRAVAHGNGKKSASGLARSALLEFGFIYGHELPPETQAVFVFSHAAEAGIGCIVVDAWTGDILEPGTYSINSCVE